jgi:hypothetical protein
MSFLDKMKNATGIGLNSTEAYHRAYEKGVNLERFDLACELFAKAAEKCDQEGQPDLARRARANQYLYSLLYSRDFKIIDPLLAHLNGLQEIEEIGSETTVMSVPELYTELEARRFELAAFGSGNAPAQAQQLHTAAAQKFQAILRAPLKTYRRVPMPDHNDSAEERYFLNQGHATYYMGVMAQDRDPMEAAERISEAARYFKQAKDDGLRARMEALVGNLRLKRTCWMCHREMQGFGLNILYYPARTTQYGRELVGRLGQDTTAISDAGDAVSICLPCATMVQHQADHFGQMRANEVRSQLQPQIENLMQAVNNLANRVSCLEHSARP